MEPRALGTIAFVQVSPVTVKVAGDPERYDPAPLTRVEQLLIDRRGPIGIASDGRRLMDVHHADHPHSRNRQTLNGVSIGFTSHYAVMRACFGSHLTDGCAAENIVVDCDVQRSLADLGTFLIIVQPQSGQCVVLDSIQVAEPCLPFTRYALGAAGAHAPAEVKAGLQFLRTGMRGFYLLPLEQTVQSIAPGAVVYASDADTPAAALAIAQRLMQQPNNF